ncbi:MAG: hypothetical protein WBP45_07210 [Daejeonella sp.]
MQNQNIISEFYLYLNKYQGDHIRISIKTSEKFNNDFSSAWKFSIEEYLFNEPSNTLPIQYPLTIFFLDFPNNVILDNLYKPYPLVNELLNELDLQSVRKNISEMIIKELSKEIIDAGALFSFCIYLQLDLIKAVNFNKKKILTEVEDIITHLCRDLPTEQLIIIDKMVVTLYNKNRSVLKEIFAEVWNDDSSNEQNHWLMDWSKLCTGILKNGYPTPNLYETISSIIYKHLYLNSRLELILSSKLIYNLISSSE